MLLPAECIRMRSWRLSSSWEAFFKEMRIFTLDLPDMKFEATAKLFSCVGQMLLFGSSSCVANVLRVQTFLCFTCVFRSMDQMRLSGTMVLYGVCVLWHTWNLSWKIYRRPLTPQKKDYKSGRCCSAVKIWWIWVYKIKAQRPKVLALTRIKDQLLGPNHPVQSSAWQMKSPWNIVPFL